LKDKDKLPAKQSKHRFTPMQGGFAPQITVYFKPERAQLFYRLNASKPLENIHISCDLSPVQAAN